jgi:glycerophosphoryl diester phosphodiesterase
MVEIIGHRGARWHAPENTLPGFLLAIKYGVDWIDVDVVATKDSQLVAYHDLFINPDFTAKINPEQSLPADIKYQQPNPQASGARSSMSLLIKSKTLAELSHYQIRLDPNSNYGKLFPEQQFVPNHLVGLQQVLDYVNPLTNNTAKLQIEVKNDLFHPEYSYSPEVLARLTYDFINQNQLLDRVKIQAFDWRILYILNQLNPQIKTAYLISYDFFDNWRKWYHNNTPIFHVLNDSMSLHPHNSMLNVIAAIKNLGGYSFEPEDNELTQEQLNYAHSVGLKVYVWPWPEHSGWVVNSKLLQKLINFGVDGIITDDPNKIKHN